MKKIFVHKAFHIAILIAILLFSVHFNGSENGIRERLQYATFDYYNRIKPRPPTNEIVIIDLDEASLRKLGQWPWPRTTMADMVLTLKEMGAKVVAFDMVFAEPDRTSPARIAKALPQGEAYLPVRETLLSLSDNDETFAKAISDTGIVVTGFTGAKADQTVRDPYQVKSVTFLLKDKKDFVQKLFGAEGIVENLPIFSHAAAGNGSFMASPDIDGIMRRVSLLVRYPKVNEEGKPPSVLPMLGVEALRVSYNKDSHILVSEDSSKDQSLFDTNYEIKIGAWSIPVERDGKMWVYYRDISDDEYISAQKLFDPKVRETLRDKINGKIVFVGTSAEGLRDIRSTPLDIFVPGVEVHVNLVEQVLQGIFLKRPAIVVGAEALVIAFSGLLIILCASMIHVVILGFFSLALMASMVMGSWWAYANHNLLLDPVYPSFVISFLFLVAILLSYIRLEAERRHIRQAFGYYISPAFMNELTKNPDRLKLGGENRALTIMFTDIRGFTSISEKLSPEELIQLMNNFLTPMSDLVMSHRGTIDKYMGDAMMAFWNAPLDDENHARHACLTALKMNESLVPVNEALRADFLRKGKEPLLLNAGIGINSGDCAVGNMGSRQRFAYSALGDSVNLASRLESQTKTYGLSILVGEETYRLTEGLAFVEVDFLRVKGKTEPVRIYSLVGDEDYAKLEAFKQWMVVHNDFLASYRVQNFGECVKKIERVRALGLPAFSKLYDVYAQRVSDFIKTPPQEGWDGVYDALNK